jgi:hypothetical protein
VKDGTTEPISVENAFLSYLHLQGRWLLSQLKTLSHNQHNEVCHHLATANFLQESRVQIHFQEMEERWNLGTGEVPSSFKPLNKALGIGFPDDVTQENMKHRAASDPEKQLLKW